VKKRGEGLSRSRQRMHDVTTTSHFLYTRYFLAYDINIPFWMSADQRVGVRGVSDNWGPAHHDLRLITHRLVTHELVKSANETQNTVILLPRVEQVELDLYLQIREGDLYCNTHHWWQPRDNKGDKRQPLDDVLSVCPKRLVVGTRMLIQTAPPSTNRKSQTSSISPWHMHQIVLSRQPRPFCVWNRVDNCSTIQKGLRVVVRPCITPLVCWGAYDKELEVCTSSVLSCVTSLCVSDFSQLYLIFTSFYSCFTLPDSRV